MIYLNLLSVLVLITYNYGTRRGLDVLNKIKQMVSKYLFQAERFHKKWTTPPPQSPQKEEYFNLKRSDADKGFERIGRWDTYTFQQVFYGHTT